VKTENFKTRPPPLFATAVGSNRYLKRQLELKICSWVLGSAKRVDIEPARLISGSTRYNSARFGSVRYSSLRYRVKS
jgi:hypothetical protein